MSLGAEQIRAELIDGLATKVHDRITGPKAVSAELFLRLFYSNVSLDDLRVKDPEALYGAAMTLWSFYQSYKPGQPKIRIYNPLFEEHGWKCDHTIFEVISDDMPFLVDSITAVLTRLDMEVHLAVHPVFSATRDENGLLTHLAGKEAQKDHASHEAVIHVEVNEQTDPDFLEVICESVAETLSEVRATVEDWRPMKEQAAALMKELENPDPAVPEEETREVRDFIHWLSANHYTFLGYREYALEGTSRDPVVTVVPGTGLGLLRSEDFTVFEELRNLGSMPEEVGLYVRLPKLLVITKSNHRSPVHRPVHMDAVAIKRFNDKGEVAGLRLFVGLFTSNVYTNSPTFIPVLRRKIARVVEHAGFNRVGHDGKRLLNILENLPRDELFQSSVKDLLDTALGVLRLQDRQRVALFVRMDQFKRFASCLVYVPRDRYDTTLRQKIHAVLDHSLNGKTVAFYTLMADSPLARLHIIIKTSSTEPPVFDVQEVEHRIAEIARSWSDHLHDALVKARGEEQGLRQFRRFGEAFPSNYREHFQIEAAVQDIARLEKVVETNQLGMNLYHAIEAAENRIRFKVYHSCEAVTLSDTLPMLENMGFKVLGEIPYEISSADESCTVWIHDFGMETASGGPVKVGDVRDAFQEAFERVWNGEMENDGFNRLVVTAGLPWRQVVILRAYAKFLRQAAFTFSQSYIEEALANNPKVTRLLVQLFEAQFDPKIADAEHWATETVREITEELDNVANADEDRILRSYLDLIRSTLRTNFFQLDAKGEHKPYLSMKIDSRALAELPLPRPMVEIFVYSPRVEAVHLRGGRVARGGIRWSDRREDFRTEILGLMKAQMVKNAVIVPVGSKGGFVVKQPPADPSREAQLAEGIACYQIMMRGLLDLTDNLVGGRVVPPHNVIRRDVDDPYLVVAADKGTATFSDIANEISLSYGFWLGDAFASGGSHGYDHKVMGITAQGAWESVKRHFRELGLNIQNEDFTAVGVGDMAGDVFGNGMLRSRHTRLLGAFNHMHIFIDPDPDPEKSFDERERLFKKPRSSWADYNAKLISKGGGIFERRAKTIELTPEIKGLFGLTQDKVPPNDLIKALLKARVDLLWFGGIGTYIKESGESHGEAGDRSNDSVRVDGKDIRARVIGEGANLGVTQRGRIEIAMNGGCLNTDAIDNSAGVDCSDHEVNIKILLNHVVARGDMTEKQRNQLLESMTEEVGQQVLRDNYLQTQAISLVERQGHAMLDHQDRMMRLLEKAGRLNRDLEFLPDGEVLDERMAAKKGLTRPEISVLMPYSKLWLYDEILESDLPDEPVLEADLVRYFPSALRKKFRGPISEHRLKREIIATVTTNSMINRVGGTFVTQLMEKTGMGAADVARAYLVARDAFDLRSVWDAIEATDNKVSAEAQLAMLLETTRLVERATLWLLRYGPKPLDIGSMAKNLGAGITVLREQLHKIVPRDVESLLKRHAKEFIGKGVPSALAEQVTGLIVLASSFDLVRIAANRSLPVENVARTYFAVGTRFGLGWLRAAAERQDLGSHWQKLAAAAMIEDLYSHQRDLTDTILTGAKEDEDADKLVNRWIRAHAREVERADQLVTELRTMGDVDLAMLTVAGRQLRTLTDT